MPKSYYHDGTGWRELLRGEQGEQGIQGELGSQGIQGDTGPRGLQGVKGDTGDQGPPGDIGPPGEKGVQGEPGPRGVPGADGARGPEGPRGPQGIQGQKGNKGDPGPQGDSATPAEIQNITADALQAPGAVRDAFNDALRHYGVPKAEGSPGARLVFGAIRNYGSGGGYWQPIDDSGHDPVGIASVTTTEDRITITSTPVDNGTIVGGSLIAVTDETLAKNGYFVGGSGGGGTTHLMLGRNKSIGDRVTWNGSSFQLDNGADFTLEWNSPSLTLHHEWFHGGGGVNINWQGTASSGQFVTPAIVAEVADRTIVQFFDASGTRITSPHAGCRFYFTRYDTVPSGGIDPRKVDHSSGNIWFMLIQTYR